MSRISTICVFPVLLLALALPTRAEPITPPAASPPVAEADLPPLPKLTPWEECYSQIADERIAACTVVLEQEERESHERVTAFIPPLAAE